MDLTELARKGELDPLIGRGNEMDLLFSVLGRKHKNNPVLVGDAGVGKTAIVEGIARKIVDGTAPEFLRDKKIFAINLTKVTAGTRLRGDFEERVKLLIEEIKGRPEVITFIDELHMLAGAGSAVGGLDASNIMKPALARGDLRCIGATTMDEYRRYIEKDSALERRFQPITVDPSSAEETLEILKGLKDRYQQHHDVTYTDDALKEAVILSERYRMDRRLPDSAIDLIDMAGSEAKQHGIKNITSTEIAHTLEKITRISVLTTKQDRERLQKCEEALNKRIIGCPRFCRVMHEIVNGMADLERPKAVIFLAGGTGLGKTYAAKEFHRFMFGSLKNLIKLNMTEFTAPHTVARLIGAPPGYVGYDDAGQLTERVRRNPSTAILIDEIEKAHPEVWKIFFQIFEEGRLTDSQGREARFNECFIFMTSNIQVNIEDGSGFGFSHRVTESPDVDEAIKQALKKAGFEDAFINRIDNFVFFTLFCNEDLGKIVDLMVGDLLGGHLKGRELKFELTQDARKFLAERGFSPESGARELRRVVRTYLLSPLGKVIDSFKKGDTFVIKLNPDRIGLEFSKKEQD